MALYPFFYRASVSVRSDLSNFEISFYCFVLCRVVKNFKGFCKVLQTFDLMCKHAAKPAGMHCLAESEVLDTGFEVFAVGVNRAYHRPIAEHEHLIYLVGRYCVGLTLTARDGRQYKN